MGSSAVGAVALGVLRALAWGYYLQPWWLRRAWGNALGFLLRKLGLRARIVEQNLLYAFPEDERRRKDLFVRSYSHLGNLVLEILLVLGPMRRFVERYGEVRGLENWREAKRQGRGVIFLSSHLGNWEVMSALGAVRGGVDLMIVTKRLKPEWLHRAIERGRRRCGVSATYEPRTMKDILASLKRNGTVGIVLDQYAGPPIGVRVPMFGVPVGTSTAVAALAKRTGAWVLPVVCYRAAGGRWIADIGPPLGWREGASTAEDAVESAARELAENTAVYSARLERDILAHPEQWLWIHRRFKGDLSPLREGEWSRGRVRA